MTATRTAAPAANSRPPSVVRDLSELPSLEDFWRRSARDSDNPFSTYDWNRAWIRHFSHRCDEWFVLAHADAQSTRCLFPLLRRGRSLDFIGSEMCDFQDVVAGAEAEIADGLEDLMHYVRKRGFRFSPGKLSERGRLLPELERSPWEDRFCIDRKLLGPCPWIEVTGDDLETVTRQFGKSTRKGVRRRVRQLRDDLGVRLRVVEGIDGIDRNFLERAAHLHRALQREKDGYCLFDEPGFEDFLLEIARSEEVGLVGFALESAGGELIAFELGCERLGRYHSWLGAYDLAYSDYRPGTSLQALAMAELGGRGAHAYDFLCGGELYKFRFADREYRVVAVDVAARNPATLTAAAVRKLERRVRPSLKRSLQKAGLYRTNYRIDELQ